MQTFSGQHINVSLDGTIEVSAEDAQYFVRDGWSKLAEWTTEEDATAERSKPQPIQTVPQPGSMSWFEARRRRAEPSDGTV